MVRRARPHGPPWPEADRGGRYGRPAMRHVRADELPPGAPDDDLVVEGENLTALARLPDELSRRRLHRPALQHRPHPAPPRHRRAPRRRRRRPHRLRRPPLPHRAPLRHGLRRARPRRATSPSSRRASRRPAASSPPTGPSTSTSTTARPTTARSSSTASSAAILPQRDRLGLDSAPAARAARQRSTTRSSSTSRTRPATTPTPPRSTASRTWRRGHRYAREGRTRGKLPSDCSPDQH